MKKSKQVNKNVNIAQQLVWLVWGMEGYQVLKMQNGSCNMLKNSKAATKWTLRWEEQCSNCS